MRNRARAFGASRNSQIKLARQRSIARAAHARDWRSRGRVWAPALLPSSGEVTTNVKRLDEMISKYGIT